MDLRLGDVVQLRKPHPCGGSEWTIIRLGADIGLRCRTCNRRVLLARTVVERRLKRFVERGPEGKLATPGASGEGATLGRDPHSGGANAHD